MKKKFDCIEMKRRIQEKLYTKTRGNIEKLVDMGNIFRINSEIWRHFSISNKSLHKV